MTKKYPKMNVTKEWFMYLVDTTLGTSIAIANLKDPTGTGKLLDAMWHFVNTSSATELYKNNHGLFITEMSAGIMDLYNEHCGIMLLNYLQEGMPGKASIIMPSAMRDALGLR